MIRAIVALTAIIGAAVAVPANGQRSEPDEIPGLVAWYRAASLGLNNDEPVEHWRDDSGNGHDLTSDDNGLPALYNASTLNGSATVLVRNANSYTVAGPFDLADYTIFLVYAPGSPDAALLRSDADNYSGILLRADGQFEQFRHNARETFAYGEPTTLENQFGITVLGRQSGGLKAFLNGVDLSTGNMTTATLRVGKFFDLSQTRAVRNSGDRLRIAEMVFFDRYLSNEERDGLVSNLAGRYGLDVAVRSQEAGHAPTEIARYGLLAQLSTTFTSNINGDDPMAIPWDLVDEMDLPFSHDPVNQPTRLVCTTNDTRIRLRASLPLISSVADTSIRMIFRVNGGRRLRGEAQSRPFSGNPPFLRSVVDSEVIAVLNEGDYIEVVAIREGAEGEVKLVPEQAILIAEVK